MDDFVSLLDWRRQLSALYQNIRDATDAQAAHRHWQQERNRLFADHPQSAISETGRAGFAGLPVWDYDPAFAFRARIKPLPEERFTVQTSAGHDMPLVRFGRVRLPMGTLDVYWIDVYGGGVFLPFRDATAGRETYGGGRYLLDTVKGADLGGTGDTLTLDFNFAYHPSCFYDGAGAAHWPRLPTC